ncbi:CAMK family protein kinase [Trichomonas vaginalis G3]|uniref:CAMK family protein kinase n=1 Tax=Trichomonas vaginalis (strain ATCC PRA-98 / G3) TaxID=412133 RepID=A2F8W1_TRIV3|nr:protein serine/threonine kinase protein [Trichomonas vaginalis G3]EAX98643.1 CAMK family protein kinase [Trichomonas vaginalis G3]KAI5508443.1 protein serine/threonine kinase protein [Trichomonas vaginalis G3]|eukprot:XP_001311573.1 CAMK family protein kinase [Trichomonas vaginalis G3]
MKDNGTLARSANLPFVIRDYKFTQMIGKGGFAEVFLVEHIKFLTLFVAKVMTVDASEVQSTWEIFDSETKALSTLNHPHIIRLYDHFQIGCQFYYILEYCPNGSLFDEIEVTRGLPIPRFLTLASQIVSALAYCHANGIAHRDIKPGNILLDENKRAKLTDFGLCMQTKIGELHKTFSGSCEFTAPEIFLRKPNDPFKGDVWALGIVFAILITGTSPWKCDSLGALRQLALAGNYKLNEFVPKEIADVIARMIVVDPDKRITMAELAEMPLFRHSHPTGIVPSLSKTQIVQLDWEPIERPSRDNSYDDLNETEEIRPVVSSKVRSASSLFLHKKPQNRVKSRMRLNTVKPTFPGIEEDDLVFFS